VDPTLDLNYDIVEFGEDSYFLGLYGYSTMNTISGLGFITVNNTCVDHIAETEQLKTKIRDYITSQAEDVASINFTITILVFIATMISMAVCMWFAVPCINRLHSERADELEARDTDDVTKNALLYVRSLADTSKVSVE